MYAHRAGVQTEAILFVPLAARKQRNPLSNFSCEDDSSQRRSASANMLVILHELVMSSA